MYKLTSIINMMKKLSKILNIISITLLLICVVLLVLDYIYYYPYGSAPFYVYILVRSIEFILPAIICFVISCCLKKK